MFVLMSVPCFLIIPMYLEDSGVCLCVCVCVGGGVFSRAQIYNS